jgi:hypothetical protein
VARCRAIHGVGTRCILNKPVVGDRLHVIERVGVDVRRCILRLRYSLIRQ